MGKNKKEHRKRVAKRNQEIENQRKKIQKTQQDLLMKLIEEEKNKGLFNNPISTPITPSVDMPQFNLSSGS